MEDAHREQFVNEIIRVNLKSSIVYGLPRHAHNFCMKL